VDIVVAAIAVAAFAATVIVLTGALGGARRDPVRVLPAAEFDLPDDRWLTVDELARELEVRPAEVMALVERRAVPFFVIAGESRHSPQAYRFRRDEIDDWTIG
jgi:helix-turn-helix protein